MLKDAVKLEGLVAVISLLCFWPRWVGASCARAPAVEQLVAAR
jgi:hypothetical protein